MNVSRIPPPFQPTRRRKHIVKYAAPPPPGDPARGVKMEDYNEISAKTRANPTIDARDGNIMLSTPPRRARLPGRFDLGAVPGAAGAAGAWEGGGGGERAVNAP